VGCLKALPQIFAQLLQRQLNGFKDPSYPPRHLPFLPVGNGSVLDLGKLADQNEKAEQEKEAGAAQFQARSNRLQAVIERLSDLESQTRQALEFAKTEMD